MNLCKDCKHFGEGIPVDPRAPHCFHIKALHPQEPVRGVSWPGSCRSLRADAAACGPAGLWFEPRESKPKPPGPPNQLVPYGLKDWFQRLLGKAPK